MGHYSTLKNTSFYADGPRSPLFYSGLDRNGEEQNRYQTLLKQNYQQLELAGYSHQALVNPTPNIMERAQLFPFDGRPQAALPELSLRNQPATTYRTVFVDGDLANVKKVIKKLLILSVAQDAWLRRYAEKRSLLRSSFGQQENVSLNAETPATNASSSSSSASWLSRLFPSDAESQAHALAQLSLNVRAQREKINICIQLLEVVFQVDNCEPF